MVNGVWGLKIVTDQEFMLLHTGGYIAIKHCPFLSAL